MTGGPVDPTLPIPSDGSRRGAPGDPTSSALPGAYDPTVAVPPVASPPGGPGGPGGPGLPPPAGGAGDNRARILLVVLAVVVVIAIGVVVALVASGGSDEATPSTSTTSSPSSTTSTSRPSPSTTVTTTANGPQITAYNASPNPVNCPNNSATVQVTLTWVTTNALGVSVSIDGPTRFGDFGASGNALVPFACGGSHSYTITANGQGGQTAQRTITVQGQVVPGPVTTTTTAPPPATTTTTGA